MALTVREARPGDGAAISEIHNRYIRETVVTFTTALRSPEDVAAQIAGGQRHWVSERGGEIAGFATFFAFRNGPGYAHTFEHTVLLAPQAQGKGVGRGLMVALEEGVRMAGGHSLFAGVSAENEAGVAFHAALGFREVVRLREVGWKFGRWHDLVLMQKFLAQGAPTPPEPHLAQG